MEKYRFYFEGINWELNNPKSLPEEVYENYVKISKFLDIVLADEQYVEIVYPRSKEIFLKNPNNLDDKTYRKLGELIYDFVIYGKPLS